MATFASKIMQLAGDKRPKTPKEFATFCGFKNTFPHVFDAVADAIFTKQMINLAPDFVMTYLSAESGTGAIGNYYKSVAKKYKVGDDYVKYNPKKDVAFIDVASTKWFEEHAESATYIAVKFEVLIALLEQSAVGSRQLMIQFLQSIRELADANALIAEMEAKELAAEVATKAKKKQKEAEEKIAGAQAEAAQIQTLEMRATARAERKEKMIQGATKIERNEWFYIATCDSMYRVSHFKFGIIESGTPTGRFGGYKTGYDADAALRPVFLYQCSSARTIENFIKTHLRAFLEVKSREVIIMPLPQLIRQVREIINALEYNDRVLEDMARHWDQILDEEPTNPPYIEFADKKKSADIAPPSRATAMKQWLADHVRLPNETPEAYYARYVADVELHVKNAKFTDYIAKNHT